MEWYFCAVLWLLLTWDIKKARIKAELELKRIKDKAHMYDMQSLEEEDHIACAYQYSTMHDGELSKEARNLKASYA